MDAARRGGLLLACLVVLCTAPPAAGQKLLRWKFAPGQSFRVSFQQTTRSETTGAQKQPAVTIKMAMDMTWRVTAVDEAGTARMSQSFDRLAMEMKSGDVAPIEYDSASSEQPAGAAKDVAAAVAPFLQAEFHLTMTARGEIKEVKLSDEADRALAARSADGAKSFFSPDGISRVLRQAVVVLPDMPLAAGDQWETAYLLDASLGQLTQTNVYTYQGPAAREGRQLERIDVKSTLEQPDEQPAGKTQLKELQQTGELWFDAERGRFVESRLTQALTTERVYRDMRIRVRTNSNVTMLISE